MTSASAEDLGIAGEEGEPGICGNEARGCAAVERDW